MSLGYIVRLCLEKNDDDGFVDDNDILVKLWQIWGRENKAELKFQNLRQNGFYQKANNFIEVWFPYKNTCNTCLQLGKSDRWLHLWNYHHSQD
jgi:hypothetical protein